MAWGVLEDRQTSFPPGTILLGDHKTLSEDEETTSNNNLKKARNVILQPQPTDSPNDPLNWSFKTKAALCLTNIITVVAINGIQGMLGTAGRILAERYDVSYPNLVRTLQPPSIAAGALALFFVSAFGAIWGKRLPIVASAFVIWITVLAGYFANSLDYYRAVNIVSHIFGIAPDLLSAPIITDMIFVHQRGRLMAIASVVAIVGIDVSSVISGNIVERLGVKYLYIVSFGVMAWVLLMNFFFTRETTFHRGAGEKTPLKSGDHVYDEETKDHRVVEQESSHISATSSQTTVAERTELAPHSERPATNKEPLDVSGTPSQSAIAETPEPKHPWTWHLRLYHGRSSKRRFVGAFLQPFPLLVFPSVLFSTVVNGAMLTWSLISSIISGQVLLYPPYSIQPAELSYLQLPGSGAALVASLASGFLSDWMIKWMARRNGGVYEPEYRLLMLIPAVILSTTGFLMLGPMYECSAPVWQIVLANLLFSIAMPFGSAACTTYILDTMQHRSSEAFVATMLFKSLYLFLATYYVPGWFADNGAVYTYRALAILNVCFGVVGIPMYCLGKRWRGLVSRNAFLGKMAGQDVQT